MAAQTVIRAMTTDRANGERGPGVNDRAAAGGPIMRLKISRAPTTGHGHGGGERQDERGSPVSMR